MWKLAVVLVISFWPHILRILGIGGEDYDERAAPALGEGLVVPGITVTNIKPALAGHKGELFLAVTSRRLVFFKTTPWLQRLGSPVMRLSRAAVVGFSVPRPGPWRSTALKVLEVKLPIQMKTAEGTTYEFLTQDWKAAQGVERELGFSSAETRA
jgi:hypothetical protein